MHFIADRAVVFLGSAVFLQKDLFLTLLRTSQLRIALHHAVDFLVQVYQRDFALPLFVVDLVRTLLAAAHERMLVVDFSGSLVVVDDILVLLDVQALVRGELAPLIEEQEATVVLVVFVEFFARLFHVLHLPAPTAHQHEAVDEVVHFQAIVVVAVKFFKHVEQGKVLLELYHKF
jgi:hypothetical protein